MLMIVMIDRACSIVNKTCFSHIYKVHNITVTRNYLLESWRRKISFTDKLAYLSDNTCPLGLMNLVTEAF